MNFAVLSHKCILFSADKYFIGWHTRISVAQSVSYSSRRFPKMCEKIDAIDNICLCGTCVDSCKDYPEECTHYSLRQLSRSWNKPVVCCQAQCLQNGSVENPPISLTLECINSLCESYTNINIQFNKGSKKCLQTVLEIEPNLFVINRTKEECINGNNIKLNPEIAVNPSSENVIIHTSCSQPLYIGQTFPQGSSPLYKVAGFCFQDGNGNADPICDGNYDGMQEDCPNPDPPPPPPTVSPTKVSVLKLFGCF